MESRWIIKMMVFVVVVGCFFTANVFAVTTFEEKSKNGEVIVTQWQKTLEKKFVTELVPDGLSLNKEQKEKLWLGETVLTKDKETFFTGILRPNVRKMENTMTVTWTNGKYKINNNKKYFTANPNILTIMLCIIETV